MHQARGALVPARAALAGLLTCLALLAFSASGCDIAARDTAARDTGLRVLAAENFWGSIASQIAGSRASVRSVIVDPAQDPHSYEPSASDARRFATAQLVIVNGIGYDNWASRLLAADAPGGPIKLDVGRQLRLRGDQNPHRWYAPGDVEHVAASIAADLSRLDPLHAHYYGRQLASFERFGLARYHALIAYIRRRYGGTPIGASESIATPLAQALGLRLITPPGFMNAISEGTDVSAADAQTTQRQITSQLAKVWLFNTQNATPEVQRLNELARAAGVRLVRITETLSPATSSFEAWQVSQLEALRAALGQPGGRAGAARSGGAKGR